MQVGVNRQVANIFYRIADALEIKGESPFKVQAYRKAARIIEDIGGDLKKMVMNGEVLRIEGIGEGLAKKIKEYVETGKIKKLEEAVSGLPEGLFELMDVQGLGPKTIQLAYRKLGVRGMDDLVAAAKDGSLAALPGMGQKRVENILRGIRLRRQARERISVWEGLVLTRKIIEYLGSMKDVRDTSPAGSLRRMKETIGDIDILATGKNGKKIIDYFCKYDGVERVVAAGETKASIMVMAEGGLRQVDLRIVRPEEYGSALQYFTGSKPHNIKLRHLAKERGWKISEYGVFEGERKIAGRSEKEVYGIFGMDVIPPELREDRGEVEAALEGRLPSLVTLKDIRGDMHVHSNYSDGVASLERIARKAIEMGYSYVAICDHSQSLRYASGVTPERLKKQWKEIDRLNKKYKGFKLLKGAEVDILADGSLDYPDELLKELDIVIAALHQGFKKDATRRLISAVKHPLVHVIAHPTGRLISKRDGYDVDIEKVFEAVAHYGKVVEINAYYDRLDLNDTDILRAKRHGVKFSIGTDCHRLDGFDYMKLGVATARRGWLTKQDVLNCMSYRQLIRYLKEMAEKGK